MVDSAPVRLQSARRRDVVKLTFDEVLREQLTIGDFGYSRLRVIISSGTLIGEFTRSGPTELTALVTFAARTRDWTDEVTPWNYVLSLVGRILERERELGDVHLLEHLANSSTQKCECTYEAYLRSDKLSDAFVELQRIDRELHGRMWEEAE